VEDCIKLDFQTYFQKRLKKETVWSLRVYFKQFYEYNFITSHKDFN
jgi:hypothetical protein